MCFVWKLSQSFIILSLHNRTHIHPTALCLFFSPKPYVCTLLEGLKEMNFFSSFVCVFHKILFDLVNFIPWTEIENRLKEKQNQVNCEFRLVAVFFPDLLQLDTYLRRKMDDEFALCWNNFQVCQFRDSYFILFYMIETLELVDRIILLLFTLK